jgi:hypothetical protein
MAGGPSAVAPDSFHFLLVFSCILFRLTRAAFIRWLMRLRATALICRRGAFLLIETTAVVLT